MKFKKPYLSDISSTTVPRNLNKLVRLAQIVDVDGQKGTCSLRFLDIPSYRSDVLLPQSSEGIFNIPETGAVCVVIFDQYDRAWIVSYVNLGHEDRVKNLKTLPKLKSGEKFTESGGSYFYIKNNGNIIISTLSGNTIEIENNSGTIKLETINWKLITEGGLFYFGLTKRLVPNIDGTATYKIISDITGDSYTELNLQVMETADGTLGIDPNVTPLIDLTLGTLIDNDGNKLNKTGNINLINSSKEVVLHLQTKAGVQIDIDKEGHISILTPKLNINNASVDIIDSDAISGIDTNNPVLGTLGQHAAREHDKVSIPIGSTFTDTKHAGLTEKNGSNLISLTSLAAALVSAAPGGPCILNPALLPPNLSFDGEIVEGSKNIYVGDD